jgi:cytochrome P450
MARPNASTPRAMVSQRVTGTSYLESTISTTRKIDKVFDAFRLNSTPHKHMFRYLGILNSERIVVTSPEALAEVCTRNYDFPKSRQAALVAGDLLGRGLVLTDGDEHKQQRKMLLPSFSSKNIRALYPCFGARRKRSRLRSLRSTALWPMGEKEWRLRMGLSRCPRRHYAGSPGLRFWRHP